MQILPFVSVGKPIWALDDISFQVEKGEALGIVGPNGAGKTTLLRVLSRVTKPTLGRAILRGRVGSLLEVGTGFHPELSGRENVFMGGSVLGMTKREINSKFSEIVEFSGVEDFIDVPVKRYSSGMRVRLAFSVAVHLEPEILLVDEVLSVGDAAFRQKSLMKMTGATRENRTVIFVSHNLESIEGLCDKAIFLYEGRIASEGDPQDVIRHYLETVRSKTGVQSLSGIADLTHHAGRIPGGTPVLKSVKLVDETGEETAFVRVGEDVVFQVVIDSGQARFTSPTIKIGIDNVRGIRVVTLNTDKTLKYPFEFQGEAVVTCRFEECRLVPGLYYVKLATLERGRLLDVIENAIAFEVLPGDLYGTGRLETSGIIEPRVSWTIGNVGEPQVMADHS